MDTAMARVICGWRAAAEVPSPAITNGNKRFLKGHCFRRAGPDCEQELPLKIAARHAARIQSIPKKYFFPAVFTYSLQVVKERPLPGTMAFTESFCA
jgi:site-specific DNA-cytosine methylase